MSEQITFYDLPSKPPCRGWSGNTLKTRLALNYKGLPYKTEWVPYIHLQEKIKSLGVPPNPEGSFSTYSVPTVHIPDSNPEYIMDSAKIAEKLEELQPEPSLHLKDTKPIIDEVSQALGQVILPLAGFFMPRLQRDIVAQEDMDWFAEDRGRRFGMSLEEFEKHSGGEQAWKNATPGLNKLDEITKSHKKDGGPFILGSEVSYGDFMIVAAIHMFAIVGDDGYEKFVDGREGLKGVYEACRKWLEKSD